MARRAKHKLRNRLVGLSLFVGLAWMGWETVTWPRVAELASHNPKTTAFIERWKELRRAAGRSDTADWRWVPYAEISPNLKRAVLVSEDINFFGHHGFEVAELKAAVTDAVEDREMPRGASTITQQVAKNLWLSPSRNPLRKAKEAILTLQLERSLDKRRILEIYLNVAEFGDGIYGAEAAARRYFGKGAAALDENEASALAASLPNPVSWNPGSRSATARRRADGILRRMERAQFLRKEI
jgi:monofunctional biosynthetic peptidoglycan transglycosylase